MLLCGYCFGAVFNRIMLGRITKVKKNQALENLVIHFCGKKSTISKLLIILCENFTLAIKF